MDYLIIIVFFLLVPLAFSSFKMGQSMRLLFRYLKNEDLQLWNDLAQPYVSFFDTGAYLRANTLLFAGCEKLASHDEFASRYVYARKWFYIFQGIAFLMFILLTIQAISSLSNAL